MSTLCIKLVHAAVIVAMVTSFPAREPQRFLSIPLRESYNAHSLLKAVQGILGEEFRQRVANKQMQVEISIQPFTQAVPQNQYHRVENAIARFLLHRYFLQTYGWEITNLSHNGKGWSEFSPVEILKGLVPKYDEQTLFSYFHTYVGTQGWDLFSLSMLAVAFEHVVYVELTGLLTKAYAVTDQTMYINGYVSKLEATYLMKVFMTLFVMRNRVEDFDLYSVSKLKQSISDPRHVYQHWERLEQFLFAGWETPNLNSTKLEAEVAGAIVSDKFSFSTIMTLIEDLTHRLRSFHLPECGEMKNNLLTWQYKGTGYVRLSDFYNIKVDGEVYFREHPVYMEKQGCLFGANTSNPLVSIPNYLASRTNCFEGASSFMICCPDACEPLFQDVEMQLGAPHGTVEEIVTIMSSLPSDIVQGSQRVSVSLRAKLESIANRHGGYVPIHGRLFRQWLHNLHPQICAFPHASGLVRSDNVFSWAKSYGYDAVLSADEIDHYAREVRARTNSSTEQHYNSEHAWSMQEELVATRYVRQESYVRTLLRRAMKIASIGALSVITCWWMFSRVASNRCERKTSRLY